MTRRYLLDTNHAGEIFKESGKFPAIQNGTSLEVSLCYPGVGELWFMVYNSARVHENRERMRQFLANYYIYPFDDHAAKEFGAIQAELLRSGRKIKHMDMQLAAIARANNLTVLTADKHFHYVHGITCENWLS